MIDKERPEVLAFFHGVTVGIWWLQFEQEFGREPTQVEIRDFLDEIRRRKVVPMMREGKA